jgi:calcineurin-like phosphoesterase family protein
MSTRWFTSDTHFLHKMVAALRGFTELDANDKLTGDSSAHDEAIIVRWNALIRPEDVVWHLGDVSISHRWNLIMPLVKRLNGRKHLVTGNHDAPWPGHSDSWKHQRAWLEAFESVQAFARVKIGDESVMLSHFPYGGDHTHEERATQYRLRNEGAVLLHGHLHAKERITDLQSIHVGLDAWGLQPVSEAEVREIIASKLVSAGD